MKVQDRILDVTSTIEGEKIDLTVDPNSIPHLMKVLTDLYSDPELAVVREYSTNAFDAHVEAGVTRPIEITLPSPLAPYFTVRDYGEGLNAQDIREIYSQYGASTKRHSNDVVGMLGLGCKSALTYADQFTLTGIKNGVAIQVCISRDEDGGGSMTVVDQRKSDDPSGVEIVVPARRHNTFAETADSFFRFWTPGTVLINGEAPERIGGQWIAEDICLTTETDESYVVMGNVAYPFLSGFSPSYYAGNRHGHIHAVCFVNIGDVMFTPSRESLQEIKVTKDTLNNLCARVVAERDAAFLKQINDAATKHEALALERDFKKMGYSGPREWKGNPMPADWRHENDKDARFVTVNSFKTRYRSKGWEVPKVINLFASKDDYGSYEPGSYIWIKGYEFKSENSAFTPYKKLKLEQFFKNKNIDTPTKYVLVNNMPDDSDWIDPSIIYEWSDIQKEKIIRDNQGRGDGRPTGSYSGFVNGFQSRSIVADDIDTSLPLFWEWGGTNYWSVDKPRGYHEIMGLHPDATVIVLGRNRSEKFMRDFPKAKKIDEYLRESAKTWAAGLTDQEKLAIYFKDNDYETRILNQFDVNKIDDPSLIEAVNARKNKMSPVTLAGYNQHKGWGADPLAGLKWENPMVKYELLTNMDSYASFNTDHIYIYLNAVYAAEQENS